MSSTSLRYTARARIVSLLRTATATARFDGGQLQVELGWPGDQIEAEAIWLESSDGTMTIPVFRGPASVGNPIARDDEFSVPVQIKAAAANQTLDEAEARAIALFAYLETSFATNPTQDGITGLLKASIGEVNGPATGRLSTGCASFIRAVVNFKIRESP